jgi:predicted O-methyltransferase YrrM
MEPSRLSFLSDEDHAKWAAFRGWMLPPAGELLYRHAKDADPAGEVVEIGSYAGKSTVCLARGVQASGRANACLHAIDIKFQPDFRPNLTRLGVIDLVDCTERPSLGAADRWTRPISFIYIDGSHAKAHAYADLLVWDMLVVPGGIVALDDTNGYMIGPNLQLQAALGAGAYELLTEVGGISFLRKRRPLLSRVNDFPLAEGSRVANVQYACAWLGSMDPAFRFPQAPGDHPMGEPVPTTAPVAALGVLHRLWNTTPRQTWGFVARQLGVAPARDVRRSRPVEDEVPLQSKVLKEVEDLLLSMEAGPDDDPKTTSTLAYLRACLAMRRGRLDAAADALKPLAELDASRQFLHYRLPIRDLATLRLAQSHDLRGARPLAVEAYERLRREAAAPELKAQAERGLTTPFTIPPLTRTLLLREYNLELNDYRAPVAPSPYQRTDILFHLSERQARHLKRVEGNVARDFEYERQLTPDNERETP